MLETRPILIDGERARVVIIEPVSSGVALVRRAREMGLEVIVLTHDDGDRRCPDSVLDLIDQRVVVDTNDDARALEAVRRIHRTQRIHAVLPGYEYYVPLAARIGAAIGVPAVDPVAARRMRDKDLMREALRASDVDQPHFALVGSEEDLAGAVDRVGLPCVVKPVDLSGSLFVRKAATAEEALEAFRAIDAQPRDLDRATRRAALVEEFVAGLEFSIEGFVEDGHVHVLSVTRKLLGPEPLFVEVGHVVPGDLGPCENARVVDYVERVIRALRLGLGAFHAEVRLSSRGPLLMEIAARLAGDRIPDLLLLARGIDLYGIMLRSHLGLGNDGNARPLRAEWAGIRYFVRPGMNGYRRSRGADAVGRDPRVVEIELSCRPGEELALASVGRLGHVIARAGSYAETMEALDAADQRVEFLAS
jgi:biotin carboxylase